MRWIAHSDVNAFYASVELLHRPLLRDKPVVVGGDEEARHGIVLTKNQIAKSYGIQTAMSIAEARRMCPDLVSIPPNYPLYLKYNKLISQIYADYTDRQEAFGLDESWVDLSPIVHSRQEALLFANDIRSRIYKELGVTVSLGISWNKIYAKLGSDYKKPDAITLFDRDNYKGMIFPLPASDLLYVGPATAAKLYKYHIETIGDIVGTGPVRMNQILGKVGEMIWVFASGNDITPVADAGAGSADGYIKSIGNSSTFPRDLVDNDDIKTAFFVLGESVSARLREAGFEARTVQIHLRPNDLSSFERQAKLRHPTFVTGELVDTAMRLFIKNYPWHTPLRSVGIRGADLLPIGRSVQLSFFDDMLQLEKRLKWEYAVDYIRNRYGYFSVQRGYLMQDRHLSNLDAKKENIIHPIGYQYVT